MVSEKQKKHSSATNMCSRVGVPLQGTLAETVSPHRAMVPEKLTRTGFISKVSLEHAYTDYGSLHLLIHTVAVLGRESRFSLRMTGKCLPWTTSALCCDSRVLC